MLNIPYQTLHKEREVDMKSADVRKNYTFRMSKNEYHQIENLMRFFSLDSVSETVRFLAIFADSLVKSGNLVLGK